MAGYDVATEAQQVRAQVGLLTEFPGLYPRMTVLQYLLFFGRLQGLARADALARAGELLRRFDLWDARDRKLDSYSKGMKQKVALIRAMLHNPQVLFLDEPTTAMDPLSTRVVRDAIAELRDERRVIVLCTHNLDEAERLADRIAVVRGGEVVAEGTAGELTERWLGAPIWELRAAHPLNGELACLAGLVDVERVAVDRIRYRTSEAAHLNPLLLGRLRDAGVGIVSLAEAPRSLEAVYLRIVGDGGTPNLEDPA